MKKLKKNRHIRLQYANEIDEKSTLWWEKWDLTLDTYSKLTFIFEDILGTNVARGIPKDAQESHGIAKQISNTQKNSLKNSAEHK